MNFDGKSLSWHVQDGVIELALHQPPCNEIGTSMLEELEQFARALELLRESQHFDQAVHGLTAAIHMLTARHSHLVKAA